MWRSASVSAKKSLSSALRHNSPPLGLLRPLSESNAANSFSRDDLVSHHHHDTSQKIIDGSFEKLPVHGLGKELTANWGKTLGYQLISRGYLTEANGHKLVSSKGVEFQPVLNEMSGDEEQRISSGEVGQAQLYKKRFEERMKIAVPVGIVPFAMYEGANQVNAMSALDISVQSSSALLLNLALFWHIKDGMKEILADYVHQEITREWITIFLRLFLLIAAKDLFFLL